MEETAYLSSAYLAPVQYYTKLFRYDKVYVEEYDHYMKQTFRNRCTLAAANGPLVLSVPIVRPESLKCPMRDIRISDHGNWRHLHWNAIESSYKNSPFFDYYQDDFRPFYEKKIEFLFDLNEQLCALVCELADLHPRIFRTSEFKQDFSGGERDFREVIHPKRDYRQADPEFVPKPYYQVFESKFGFLPNLSILDLLFNMGPESLLILRDSIVR